ncbi:MAG: molybdopterin molybdotransferase MoeA [Betaproteobacteria bacterium]|nr:molybdopterin molybdotransferase MoeA [Betaproteobacteria bacterium]
MKTLEQATEQLLDRAAALVERESVPLDALLGRVLADPIVSAVDVPSFENSQVDGYALRLSDLPDSGGLPVSQRIAAGAPAGPLEPNTVARIFTGAPVPAGADAVAMQEDCEIDPDGQVLVRAPLKQGENIRPRGGDLRAGQTALPPGRRLSAADIGLIASLGHGHATVVRRLRVAVFSSGNELRQPGSPLDAGQIYDSNRPMVMSLVRGLGAEVIDMGCLPDRLDVTAGALAEASERADVILTCGGVSVGEEDHIKAAVQQEGALALWKIAIKPGKPFAFGKVGGADFLGMPGNPVSAWVTFVFLVRPFLLKRSGVLLVDPRFHVCRAAFERSQPDPRQEFLRASLDAQGQVVPHARQNSQILSSIAESEGLVEVPMETPVRRGDLLRFYPFGSLLS